MIHFTVPGPPFGKQSVRVPKYGRAYMQKETVEYMARVADAAREAMNGKEIITGAVCLRIRSVFLIPISWPLWRKNKAGAALELPAKKPDYDNIAKMCDALRGIVWKDDAQVCDAHIQKIYGGYPMLKIWASEIINPERMSLWGWSGETF